MGTPKKIVDLLNRKAWTVNEIAKELSISRNAAHLQISKLEAMGIVEKNTQRPPKGAGKPAHEFRTVAGYEDAFSTAYRPLIDVLIQTMANNLSTNERLNLFEKTGRALAKNAGLQPSHDVLKDIQNAIIKVNSLGAMAELNCENDENYISCHSCPVATLVHKEPLTCDLVASFFSEATGNKVTVKCNRDKTVVCGFLVGKS